MADLELQGDFDTALGESFSDYISPPVPFEDASPHECCEVVWSVLGRAVTPTRLAGLGRPEVASLARRFGEYFDCEPPSDAQVRDAVAQALTRWPVGTRGEAAEPGAAADGGA